VLGFFKDIWDFIGTVYGQTGSLAIVVFLTVFVLAYLYVLNFNNADEWEKIYNLLVDPTVRDPANRRRFPFRAYYTSALSAVLDWLDRRLNPEAAERAAHRKSEASGWDEGPRKFVHAAGWRLYDRCFLLAVMYPLPLQRWMVVFGFAGLAISVFVTPVLLARLRHVFENAGARSTVARGFAGIVARVVALTLAAAIAIAVADAGDVVVAGAVAVVVVAASIAAGAVAGAVTAAVAAAVAVASAGAAVLTGAAVLAVTGTVASAGAGALGGAVAVALAAAGVIVFGFTLVHSGSRKSALVLSCATCEAFLLWFGVLFFLNDQAALSMAFTLGALALISLSSHFAVNRLPLARPVLAYLLLVVIVAAGMISERFFVLALFFVLLPLLNAQFDFLSVAATRYCLRQGTRNWWSQLIWGTADLAIGITCFLGLCLMSIAAVHGLNHLSPHDLLLFDLNAVFADPPGHVWLFATFLTTLLPTFLHLVLVVASVLVAWPRRARYWCATRLYEFHQKGKIKARLGWHASALRLSRRLVRRSVFFCSRHCGWPAIFRPSWR